MIMWCKQIDTTDLDETVNAKGCLGKLLHPRSRKRPGDKQTIRAEGPPVYTAKPSVKVSPSTQQYLSHEETKEKDTPMNTVTSRQTRLRSKSKQSSIRGQLRLGFHINGNIIVLQVIEAKKLKTKTLFSVGDSYFISIELKSDDGDSKTQMTKNVYDRNPVFTEEFVMRIRSGRCSSRLVVSLFKLSPSGYKELVGCMSFGTFNLLQKTSSSTDTYCLLNRIIGMRKHLRLSQIQQLSILADETGISSLSTVMSHGRSSNSNISGNAFGASTSPTPSEIMADDLYDYNSSSVEANSSELRRVSIYEPALNSSKLNCSKKLQNPRRSNDLGYSSLSSFSRCESKLSTTLSVLNRCSLMHSSQYQNTLVQTANRSKYLNSEKSLRLSDFSSPRTSGFQQSSLECGVAENSEAEEQCVQLIHAEDEFVTTMHKGVQRFSRPLRHGLLTPHEHGILFQNVEKLLAISEFHLKRLSDAWARSRENLCPVGEIYLAQIAVLCDAYITYFRGTAAAEELLATLLKRNQIVQFLSQGIRDDPTIHLNTFLQAPQLHLQNLVSIMDNMIVIAAPLQDPGFKSLLHVQKALTTCWDQCLDQTILSADCELSDENKDLEVHQLAMDNSTNRTTQLPGHNKQLSASAPMPSNIDSDLIELRERLYLDNNVSPFELAIPGRHILFSGDLDFVNNWKWMKSWTILLNDMIVITHLDDNDRAVVVCDPVMLKDILNTEFECLHPGEILLTVRSDSREYAWSHMRTITFRTFDREIKHTWCHVLQQRIAACQDQRTLSL